MLRFPAVQSSIPRLQRPCLSRLAIDRFNTSPKSGEETKPAGWWHCSCGHAQPQRENVFHSLPTSDNHSSDPLLIRSLSREDRQPTRRLGEHGGITPAQPLAPGWRSAPKCNQISTFQPRARSSDDINEPSTAPGLPSLSTSSRDNLRRRTKRPSQPY